MKFNLGEWRLKPCVTAYNCEQEREIYSASGELALTMTAERRDILKPLFKK